jgi:peptide/nickel transport system substrate-binding protein
VLLGAGSAPSSAVPAQGAVREGGTFNVSFFAAAFDHIDPALSYSFPGWALLDAACAKLMNYPDKPPPEGLRVIPEVAAAPPRVSADAKTFTFTLRTGFRFSDGTPVRADAFARAISRLLAPGIESGGAQYVAEIVGAAAVRAGKRATPVGVVARGNRLTIRLTRPVPDFPSRTTMGFFCAVPPNLPSDPEGLGAFPGAGPYYVAEYVRGQRVVLERNRFYRGSRPHHVDRIVADLRARTPEQVLDRIEAGEADWGLSTPPSLFDPARGLARKYGLNRSQFFVKPGLLLRAFHMNASRPLFRNNVGLRRAVNFAIDRAALVRGQGSVALGRVTDQYLPPTLPGFRDASIYPLARPDLRRARALARGNTRSGRAVLWVLDVPPEVAGGQILKRDLKKIGLEVEVRALAPQTLFSRVAQPDAPFDILQVGWAPDYIDPFQFMNVLLDSRFLGNTNLAHFSSPRYDQALRRVAAAQGDARYRAYGQLDVRVAGEAAPMAAYGYEYSPTFVSKRVGCIVLRPRLDLTAVCLK